MSIKIDIPGVGRVDVDGAAEERTMQDILKAIEARNKQDGIETKEVNEALKELGENAKDAAKGVKDLGDTSTSVSKSLAGFGKSLAATAANIAVSFVKAYDTMADKPIEAGAALVQAQIDLMAQFDKLKVDMGNKMLQGFLSWGGPITEGAQKWRETAAKVSKDVIDLGAAYYTIGNKLLAEEFQKRIKALGDLTKAGASFSGGMTEIGLLAKESGVGIATYTKAVANSRDAITIMGLSAGEAAKLMAKGYKGLNEVKGASTFLREELLALGFEHEEQGEIMALFAAQARRAGVAIENLSSGEIARGTAEYAKNLKVISDITGKDAKKIMEKAQAESLRGALADKLNAQQLKLFQASFEALEIIPDGMAAKAQLAFEQLLHGNATNVQEVAANPALMAVLEKQVDMVRSAQVSQEQAFSNTSNDLADLGKASREAQTGVSGIDASALYGVGGIAGSVAAMDTALRRITLQSGEAEKSFKSATKQGEATDKLTTGYQKSVKVLVDFQNEMEDLATIELPHYATILSEATKKAADTMTLAIKFLKHELTWDDLSTMIATETIQDVVGTAGTASTVAQSANPNAPNNTQYVNQEDIDAWAEQRRKKKEAAKQNENKASTTQKLFDNLTREELKVRKQAVIDETLKIVTSKENSAAERTAHNARIKELNNEAAEIVKRQREKGWAEDIGVSPQKAAPKPVEKSKTGKAKGGISEGPVSGYSETLHGREAVVPLPDNRSIPVQLDTGGINKQLAHQSSILNDILTALHSGNKNTSGILQQSY